MAKLGAVLEPPLQPLFVKQGIKMILEITEKLCSADKQKGPRVNLYNYICIVRVCIYIYSIIMQTVLQYMIIYTHTFFPCKCTLLLFIHCLRGKHLTK